MELPKFLTSEIFITSHFLSFPDTGVLNFDSFCAVASHFLESEDDEALQKELKEAFRLYDKEGRFFFDLIL